MSSEARNDSPARIDDPCTQLEFQRVGVRYASAAGEIWPVQDFSLTIEGGLTALLGPSGSGKTTLLGLAGLLQKPTQGDILISSKHTADLSERRRDELRSEKIGFLFQQGALIEHLTILENVMLPLLADNALVSTSGALELLAAVGLEGHEHKLPLEVSGGQAQRAAFCRAMIRRPSILLADEPTASLDANSALAILDLLRIRGPGGHRVDGNA